MVCDGRPVGGEGNRGVKGEGEEDDVRAPGVGGRKEESARAGPREEEEKEKGRGNGSALPGRGAGPSELAAWRWRRENPREKRRVGQRGPCGREEGKGKSWAGLVEGLGCLLLFLLLSFSFSILNLLKQNYLNSNEFEFKPYTLHTNKTNAPA
jgi:hypothetical protein